MVFISGLSLMKILVKNYRELYHSLDVKQQIYMIIFPCSLRFLFEMAVSWTGREPGVRGGEGFPSRPVFSGAAGGPTLQVQ